QECTARVTCTLPWRAKSLVLPATLSSETLNPMSNSRLKRTNVRKPPPPETPGADSDRRPAHAPGDSVRLPGPEKLPGERLEYSTMDTQRLLRLVLPRHLHMRDHHPVTALERGHHHHEPLGAPRGGTRIFQLKRPVGAIQDRLDTVQRLLGEDIRRGSCTPPDLQVVRPDSEHGGYPLGVAKALPDLIDDQNRTFLIQHRNAGLQGTQDDAGERFRSPFGHKAITCFR